MCCGAGCWGGLYYWRQISGRQTLTLLMTTIIQPGTATTRAAHQVVLASIYFTQRGGS